MQSHLITSVLGLPEFNFVPMAITNDCIYFRIEKVSTIETCPSCGTCSNKIHDRRKQPVKDLALHGKPVVLILIKRRFRCPCCKKVFAETYSSVARYQRMTNRLIEHIAWNATHRTFKAACEEAGVGSYTARAVFIRKANKLQVDKNAPNMLAMDEFAVKKGKGQNKYNLAIAIPSEKRLLDILPDRRQAAAEENLNSQVNNENVKVIAIDMWRPYKLRRFSPTPLSWGTNFM